VLAEHSAPPERACALLSCYKHSAPLEPPRSSCYMDSRAGTTRVRIGVIHENRLIGGCQGYLGAPDQLPQQEARVYPAVRLAVDQRSNSAGNNFGGALQAATERNLSIRNYGRPALAAPFPISRVSFFSSPVPFDIVHGSWGPQKRREVTFIQKGQPRREEARDRIPKANVRRSKLIREMRMNRDSDGGFVSASHSGRIVQ